MRKWRYPSLITATCWKLAKLYWHNLQLNSCSTRACANFTWDCTKKERAATWGCFVYAAPRGGGPFERHAFRDQPAQPTSGSATSTHRQGPLGTLCWYHRAHRCLVSGAARGTIRHHWPQRRRQDIPVECDLACLPACCGSSNLRCARAVTAKSS